MSTRGIIARATGPEGQFAGRYIHWDNYPTNRGPQLWRMLHDEFKNDVEKMLVYLIDKHPAGWSTLDNSSETGKRECYCHPKRKRDAEEGFLFTHETFARGEDGGAEWWYAFDAENNRLFIRDISDKEDLPPIDLTGPEPNWEFLECGGPDENWRRCKHYAYKHIPALKDPRIGMKTYLGQEPFEFHNAIAVIVGGKRFKMTGSGGNAAYLRQSGAIRIGEPLPSNAWVSTVIAGNGRRLEIPTAIQENGKFIPYKGVTWVMPPIKTIEHETLVGL
jgi:hypothetical protein